MKTYVLYHSADYDGIFCREIAKKFFTERGIEAEYIGWNYGDPTPAKDITPSDRVYMMDIAIRDLMDHPRLIWIDHHRTAMEKVSGVLERPYGTFHGVDRGDSRWFCIDGVAASRLAWQWFFNSLCEGDGSYLSGCEKRHFVDRMVAEPLAVRLAGEYDIWDRRDPNAEVFQYGLDAQAPPTPLSWETLLSNGAPIDQMTSGTYVGTILNDGLAARNAIQKREADTIATRSHTLEFRGLSFLALNTARCNSLSFKAGIRPEHDALMGYYWNGKQWTFSLYGAPNKPDFDLSAIAKTFGGGGHRGAAGFTCKKLPFELSA